MPATVIAERIGWQNSIRVLSGRVAELRPLYLPPGPSDRTTYLAGEIAQHDFWFPPVELPVGFGQVRTAKQLPVLTMITGYARHVDGLLIPSRSAEDLFAGWWRLIARLGAVPRTLVWDGEGAVGKHRRGASALTAETQAFRGVLGAKVVICKPADPEAKGLLERVHGYLETSFLPGRCFTGPADFNAQLGVFFAQANRRWRCSTGSTAPPSPAPLGRSGRRWPPAGSPCPASPGRGSRPWPMCSPTPLPKGSRCGPMAPRCRCAAPPRTGPADRRLCPVRKSRTRSTPPRSATANAGLLWRGAFRPGRMHATTAPRTDGIDDLLRRHPDVQAEVDAGYHGRARDFPGQVSAPPNKPGKDAPPEETAHWEQQRHQKSPQQIRIGHAIAEPKQWRPPQRYPGRRDHFPHTAPATAGLIPRPRRHALTTHEPARQASTTQPQSCTYS
jgi:transposase